MNPYLDRKPDKIPNRKSHIMNEIIENNENPCDNLFETIICRYKLSSVAYVSLSTYNNVLFLKYKKF
jgi:hypothetical protein